ncbi:hypothetical protein NDU88_006489 [Pleurodeles waltl]|uniref:Uncharacterized protein n=1 Tax=Pleurodeles waltl TaxID=8319 RepID=A0AAV7TYG7_PLEWA|nr:hypothetical protein NDU88_006489 [Pleurodeles waltl]
MAVSLCEWVVGWRSPYDEEEQVSRGGPWPSPPTEGALADLLKGGEWSDDLPGTPELKARPGPEGAEKSRGTGAAVMACGFGPAAGDTGPWTTVDVSTPPPEGSSSGEQHNHSCLRGVRAPRRGWPVDLKSGEARPSQLPLGPERGPAETPTLRLEALPRRTGRQVPWMEAHCVDLQTRGLS